MEKTHLKDDVLLLKHLCQLPAHKLLNVLNKILTQIGMQQVYYQNQYLYASGDIPILLVAHVDTVFKRPPTNIFHDAQHQVVWSPEGLGADDRAGVYAILQILFATRLKPSVLFTTGEETGGTGVIQFCYDFPTPISQPKYVIELDRKGQDECVFYLCDNQQFQDYIESFGFCTNLGTFTDISLLCPQWKVAGVNLSVGYFNEHSYSEFLNLNYLNGTIQKVIQMLEDYASAEYYIFQYPNDYFIYNKKCCICHRPGNSYNFYDIMTETGGSGWICSSCYSEYASFCDDCGNDFIDKTQTEKYCPRCRKKKR